MMASAPSANVLSSVLAKVPEQEILNGMTPSHGYDYLFYIEKQKDKAYCKLCLTTFSYNQRTSGTSSLKRHLQSKHPKVYLTRQQLSLSSSARTLCASRPRNRLTDFSTLSKKPKMEINKMKRCIIILACSKHVLPLKFFEDNVVSEGFDLPVINRRTVREELMTISQEIKEELLESNRGQWSNLILDGWKNSVTGRKHVAVMMFLFSHPSKPIFLRSYVLETCDEEEILKCIDDALEMLECYDIQVVSVVTDVAKAMMEASTNAVAKYPSIVSLRCAVHVLSLVIKDCLNRVDFIKKAFHILLRYINNMEIKKYCETQWNSIFDRFIDLQKLLECHNKSENGSSDLERISAVVSALQPFIDVLNLAQTDGCSWPSLYQAFNDAIEKCKENGFDRIVTVAEEHRFMLKNDIVALHQFMNENSQLDVETENRINRWMHALGINEFTSYLADREFHGTSVVVPRRLKLFLEHKLQIFTVSEAAVKRYFSVHRAIHTPLRASLTDDVVQHILFIRYNVHWKYPELFRNSKNDSDDDDIGSYMYESFE